MGHGMRIYLIGFMIGVIGLVAANQLRADEYCCDGNVATLSAGAGTVEQIVPDMAAAR